MHYASTYLDLALRLLKLCVNCIDLDYQVLSAVLPNK